MVLDYSERKPVSKNRTRKQPVGLFVIILISSVSMAFALGLASGWFLFKPARKGVQGQVSLAPDVKKSTPGTTPSAVPLQNPEALAAKGLEPPLTFYETLPKGGKAVIGSGLNPKKNEATAPAKPAVAAPHSPQQMAAPQPAPAVKPEERKEQVPVADKPKKPAADTAQAVKQGDGSGKYCVQVASSQDKKEAEILKAKMTEKGLAAYVVESKIKDKGTWYRVRIGRHLTQQAAGELAGKAGKGALVVPE